MVEYRYSKQRGALQDQTAGVEPLGGAAPPASPAPPLMSSVRARQPAPLSVSQMDARLEFDEHTGRRAEAPRARRVARTQPTLAAPRRIGMFWTTVDDGERWLRIDRSGKTEVVVGPRRVWSWGSRFQPLRQHVAHPGEFLMVRSRSGAQDHIAGPAEVWFDPRLHVEIEKEESLPIDANEAVLAYTKNDEGALVRRVLHGPSMFIPQPGEWLHTFSWHGSETQPGGAYRKIPHGLVFQKLWLLPDQMYHDVEDVRTSDGAVLAIKLMIFFELTDIERMLDATHDPIGDFVNAASSDVVEFVGRYDFDTFKQKTDRLNQLDTYSQLLERASQTGYEIRKIVYRGYRAPDNIQQMHDAAIESRTRLGLERETEQQAQELEDYKLDRRLERAQKERDQRSADLKAELDNQRQREEAERAHRALLDEAAREHIAALREMGVDLTSYLTQGRADQVIEVRGGGSANHLHLAPPRE
ncbi:MAG: hypothetical protein AAF735_03265 [Myxococcota bacterium]